MIKLRPDETQLTGRWVRAGSKVVGDDTCARIHRLTSELLVELVRDASGWNTLYRDPQDGRLWELSYPKGDLHGGGPPQLSCIAERRAKDVYGYGAA
jgi:hypothetical protein